MDDLKPILENHPSRAESRLLGSACLDVPPGDGATRMVVALGLTATTVAVAHSAAAASASGVAGKSVTALVGKWLAVGAVAGTVVTGTGQLVQQAVEGRPEAAERPSRAEAPSIAPRPLQAPRAPEAPREPVAAFAEVPAVPVAPASNAEPGSPGGETRTGAALHAPFAGHAAEPSAPGLGDEIRVLDEARTSLAAGRGAHALAVLDVFDARFARPVLGPEATLLRVEALLSLGRAAEARAIGERFLSRRAGGPEAQRMKSLVEAGARDAAKSPAGDDSSPAHDPIDRSRPSPR
jgi:hypothetical protein